MISVPENICLSKDVFHQSPWSTKRLALHPQGVLEVLQQHRVQSPRRQTAKALVVVQSLANALGRYQFVVDTLMRVSFQICRRSPSRKPWKLEFL